jgi:hypothetical protein
VNAYPDFLPQLMDLSGPWERICEMLHSVFTQDFKLHTTKHDGLSVVYDGRILPDGQGKEEGFWHVISKEDRHGDRLIDPRRAERLPWARPMMESEPRIELKVFDYDHGMRAKGIRRYIWVEKHDYVVVLQKRGRIYYWVTAYYVDSEGRRRDLASRCARSA